MGGLKRSLAVVVAVRNDAEALRRLLPSLVGQVDEVVVVDGESDDGCAEVADAAGVRCVVAPPGRGGQLRLGAQATEASRILFLHADSWLPEVSWSALRSATARWGRLDLHFDEDHWRFSMVRWFMDKRSRITGICTGDQGIWVDRDILQAVGGVPDQPLMEDVELSARLRKLAAPRVLPIRLVSSARRWRHQGFVRTIVKMWWFRLRYFFGASPEVLAREYYGGTP